MHSEDFRTRYRRAVVLGPTVAVLVFLLTGAALTLLPARWGWVGAVLLVSLIIITFWVNVALFRLRCPQCGSIVYSPFRLNQNIWPPGRCRGCSLDWNQPSDSGDDASDDP